MPSNIFTQAEIEELTQQADAAMKARVIEIASEAERIAGLRIGRLRGDDRHSRTRAVREVVIRKCHSENIPIRVIAIALNKDPSTISSALKSMRDAGILKNETAG